MSELKACPFCGGVKVKKHHDEGQFWDTCQTCFADGPPTCKRGSGPDWNSRAIPVGYALVSVDQLKKIHRDLDACQKLIWANMRGCDPAYYEDAQESLAHIEAMLAAAQEVDKP